MKENAAETVDRAPEKNGDAASGRPRKRIKEKIDPKYLKISVYAVISVAAAFSLCLILFRAQPFFAGAWNLIKTVLTPIIIGAVICYLLTPITDHMTRLLTGKGKDAKPWVRVLAVVLTILLILAVITGLIFLLSLFVYRGIRAISMEELRHLILAAKNELTAFYKAIQDTISGLELPAGKLENIVSELFESIGGWISDLIAGLPKAAATALFATVFSIYFLLDGKRVGDYLRHAFSVLCRESTVQKTKLLAQDADRVFSGYLRGRILDSLILGVVLAGAYRIAGVPYAFIVGILTGVVNLIPYVGYAIGYVILLLAYLVGGIFPQVWIGLIILTVIQTVDAYWICPKLMNRSIMIHPLLVIVALIAGGAVGGVVGMLIAIPVMALVKIRFDRFLERREKMKAEVQEQAEEPKETDEEKEP